MAELVVNSTEISRKESKKTKREENLLEDLSKYSSFTIISKDPTLSTSIKESLDNYLSMFKTEKDLERRLENMDIQSLRKISYIYGNREMKKQQNKSSNFSKNISLRNLFHTYKLFWRTS